MINNALTSGYQTGHDIQPPYSTYYCNKTLWLNFASFRLSCNPFGIFIETFQKSNTFPNTTSLDDLIVIGTQNRMNTMQSYYKIYIIFRVYIPIKNNQIH